MTEAIAELIPKDSRSLRLAQCEVEALRHLLYKRPWNWKAVKRKLDKVNDLLLNVESFNRLKTEVLKQDEQDKKDERDRYWHRSGHKIICKTRWTQERPFGWADAR